MVGDLDQTEVNMPTVKQLGVIAIAIALALVGATAVGILVLFNTALRKSVPAALRLQRLISGSTIISGSEGFLSCPQN